jgi:hypothetical protein
MEMRDSTICEMSESTICEMSESTICESECFHFEAMSDTPSETRVVVDRSSEAISISNNLPSTSKVFSHVAIDSMDAETPILEKMYMLHHDDTTPCLEDDEYDGHMELPTSTTPTSKECDYKGNNIGVGDAMIPLVNMNMLSYECFTLSPIACDRLNNCSFPCIACNDDNDVCVVTTLPNNCSFPRFVDNKDKIMNMFCAQCLQYSSINATKMLNTCSFKCLVCNNVNMFDEEMAPIAISNIEDFAFAHDKHVFTLSLHNHHEYYDILLDANGDVQINRCIMMDDVFIYLAHTLFLLSLVCVGTQTITSTSIEHELAKRALESIILVSSNSKSTHLLFTCFASNMLRT